MTETMELLRVESVNELVAQGHSLTGSLSKSISYTVTATDDKVVGLLLGNDYGVYLEYGVDASSIPFGGGSGSPGGTSKYIQGLARFFALKGLDQREALRAAFATAHVQSRTGMPTPGSFQFSTNQKRIGFVSNSAERLFEQFKGIIENKVGLQLSLIVTPEFQFDPIKIFM